jgi:hypothetical protein
LKDLLKYPSLVVLNELEYDLFFFTKILQQQEVLQMKLKLIAIILEKWKEI